MSSKLQPVVNDSDGQPMSLAYRTASTLPSEHVVILCHGISTDKDEYLNFFVTVSDQLAASGIDSIRFDFRGHGKSTYSPSDFSVASQLADLITIVRFLDPIYDVKRVSLFGCSFGAPPCLFVDDALNFRPFHRFLLAPVLDYSRTFLRPMSPWGRQTFTESAISKALAGERLYLSETFFMTGRLFAEMSLIDVPRYVGRHQQGITVMHGRCDDMVSFDTSAELASKNPVLRLLPFDNMEHGFTDKGDEKGNSPRTLDNVQRIVSTVRSTLLNE